MKRVVAAQLARRNIHAPVDGIVITRMIGPGEYVFAKRRSSRSPRIDPLHIEVFPCQRTMFTTVQMGQMAKVKTRSPDRWAVRSRGYRHRPRVRRSERYVRCTSQAGQILRVHWLRVSIARSRLANKQSKRLLIFPYWSVCPPSLEPTLFLGRPKCALGQLFAHARQVRGSVN